MRHFSAGEETSPLQQIHFDVIIVDLSINGTFTLETQINKFMLQRCPLIYRLTINRRPWLPKFAEGLHGSLYWLSLPQFPRYS